MTIDILAPATERRRPGDEFYQLDGNLGPGGTIWRLTATGESDRRGMQTARLTSILVPFRPANPKGDHDQT